MKILSLIIICWSLTFSAFSQTDYQKDSLSKAQRNQLLKQDNDEMRLKLESQSLKKQEADAEKNAKLEDQKAAIDLAKERKTLLGDSAPARLEGNLTISKGETVMAETRALALKMLDGSIESFLKDMKGNPRIKSLLPCVESVKPDQIGSTTPANDTKENKSKQEIDAKFSAEAKNTIIVYNRDYYKIFTDCEAFIQQIKIILSQYADLKSIYSSEVESAAESDAVTTLSVAISAIEALANLATLFRVDSEIKVSEMTIDEDLLAAKFRNLDDCTWDYYYPEIVPMKVSDEGIVKLLKDLDKEKNDIEKLIKNFKTIDMKSPTEDLKISRKLRETKRQELQVLRDKYKAKPNDVLKRQISTKEGEIKELSEGQIANDSTVLAGLTTKINSFEQEFNKVNDAVKNIKEALNKPVDEVTKSTLLRKMLIAESIMKYVDAGAFTLRVTSKSTGTNRTTKSLVSTSLKHSALGEVNFMLFQYRKLIFSNATYQFTPLTKGKDIR